ncbi:hypothetical protein AAVH_08335 [Aphelenchoides avenae]|nr:hypothetical protein AAVH_08335 [Aphelenchus avenae]
MDRTNFGSRGSGGGGPRADEGQEETSQIWMLRHLRLHLEDVHDEILTASVLHQDITTFRNFMTDPRPRRILFVSVHRGREEPTNLQAPIGETNPQILVEAAEEDDEDAEHDPLEKTDDEPSATENDETKEGASGSDREGKKLKKLKNKKKKMKKRSKSRKPKKTGEEKARTSKKKADDKHKEDARRRREEVHKEILEELVQQEDRPPTEEISLKWHTIREMPKDYREFVFVVTRDYPRMNEKSEFDQVYAVGYCKNVDRFRRLSNIAEILLGPKLDFERQVDMMLNFFCPAGEEREKWQNDAERFENFITDSMVLAFSSVPRRSRAESVVSVSSMSEGIDVESIDNLLRPRIRAFVQNPTSQSKTQLQLELSLYEIKFISSELYSFAAIERLNRALTLLMLINMLYGDTIREWVQKVLFHTIELCARVIASNLQQRVWNLVYENCEGERKKTDLSDQEHRDIEDAAKPILLELIKIGMEVMDKNSDEMVCMEKIRQCLTILEYIEEEFQKVTALIIDLRDPRRDLTFDRDPLNVGFGIVGMIWSTFEESYFETSLESGNFEAMKNVCLQLSEHCHALKETIPPVDLAQDINALASMELKSHEENVAVEHAEHDPFLDDPVQ